MAAACVCALVLAGCGGPSVDTIVAAGQRTAEQKTSRVALSTVVDAGVGQPKARTDLEGVVDLDSGAAELELRIGVPSAAAGDVAVQPLVAITDGTDAYLRPAQPPGGAASAQWTKVPNQTGADGATPTGGFGSQLRILAGGIGEIEQVGEEDVRGTLTTHYRTEVDLPRAIEAVEHGQRTVLQQLLDGLDGDVLPVEVWIADGLVHRLRYHMALAADVLRQTGEGASVTTVIEYYDHGLPVDITVPDNADEITTAPTPDTGRPPATADPTPPDA